MGFDAACTAIVAALRADAALSALTIVDNPVGQITADLTLMVYPLECSWPLETLDAYQGRGDVRVALHKKASSTAAGGIATDIAALRPYVDLIPHTLAIAYAANRFAGSVTTVGDGNAGTPWLRSERPSPDTVNGLDTVSLRFALHLTVPEEAL